MNLFSRFKKIFLIVSFLFFVWGGVAVGADKVVVGDRAYRIENVRHISTVGAGGEVVEMDFDLTNTEAEYGTGDHTDFGEFAAEGVALKDAYISLDKNSDVENIDWSNVYLNKSTIGTTYIEQKPNGQSRILAVTTPSGTYVPKGLALKEDQSGLKFLNTVEKDSGYTQGSLLDSYKNSDTSDEQKAANQQRTDAANTAVKQAQDAVDVAQAEYDNATPENKPAAQERLTAAQGRLDAAKTELKNAQDLQAGVAKTESLNEDWATCSLIHPINCILQVVSWMSLKVFSLSSWVLARAGQLLDYSIELSVNSAEFLQSLAIVNPMWAFVRDMLNMTFIFILLFIAINMVLGNAGLGGKTYTIKNDVRNVVIVAILINFSLFFAKLMVDGSNLLTLEIYQQMKPAKVAGEDQGGISDQIMNTVGLTSLVNITDIFGSDTNLTGCDGKVPGVTIAVGVFGTIFVLVLAVAFGLSAMLFFIRLPNMVYLFISSPLWIWGYAMKGGIFEKMKKEWSENMFHLCTFPIVYMLWMFGGIFAFKQLLGAKGPEGTFLKVLCENPTGGQLTKTLSVFIVFFIVIIVMMKAIKYAMTKGAGTGVGAGLAQKVIARADSAQKGLTSGLYNKAKDKTVGATKFVGAPILGAGKAILNAPGAAIKTGARLALSNTSNGIANMFGNSAAGASSPFMRKILSGTSAKFRDPKVFGSTQKEYGDAREKKAKENHAAYIKTLKDSGVFKVESEEDFARSNPGGDYDAYLKAKAKVIIKSQLGKGLMQTKVRDAQGNLTNTSYEEEILGDMYDVATNGDRKFNAKKLWTNISKKQTLHTTGAEKKLAFAGTMAHAWSDQGGRRGKGRAAATNAFTKEQEKGGGAKERKKKELEALNEQFTNLPSTEIDLEAIINSPTYTTNNDERKKYGVQISNYEREKRKLATLNLDPVTNKDKIIDTVFKIDKLKDQILGEKKKTLEKIDKKQAEIDKIDADKDKK